MRILAMYTTTQLFELEDQYYDEGNYTMYMVIHRELLRRKDS